MPLTEKGEKIQAAMKKEYGEEEGERVFYASKNAGKITGVDDARADATTSCPITSYLDRVRSGTSDGRM